MKYLFVAVWFKFRLNFSLFSAPIFLRSFVSPGLFIFTLKYFGISLIYSEDMLMA